MTAIDQTIAMLDAAIDNAESRKKAGVDRLPLPWSEFNRRAKAYFRDRVMRRWITRESNKPHWSVKEVRESGVEISHRATVHGIELDTGAARVGEVIGAHIHGAPVLMDEPPSEAIDRGPIMDPELAAQIIRRAMGEEGADLSDDEALDFLVDLDQLIDVCDEFNIDVKAVLRNREAADVK